MKRMFEMTGHYGYLVPFFCKYLTFKYFTHYELYNRGKGCWGNVIGFLYVKKSVDVTTLWNKLEVYD